MKKFKIEFAYQDTNARGLRFKNAKRTVKAKTKEEAIKKLERTLMVNIMNPVCTEITEG